ncbi:MAG: hypothetical protein LDL41_04850, partial [Coleofasciculus sp. S288]|nr:hypothetical protein [Coleofasciculus sp. S288]
WNNHAPVFETDSVLDPELAARVARLNQEGEQAYQACIAAIAQIEQNAPTERRFARRPSTATAEVPVACRQLEELRAEAENLRVTLQDVERSRTSSAYATW